MIKAIIFDMDGVISDTQHFHANTESFIFKKYGIKIKPSQIIKTYAGVKDGVTFKTEFKKHNIKVGVDQALKEKWRLMDKKTKGKIKPIDGVIKVINHFFDNGYTLAVGSSAPMHFMINVLTELNIKEKFQALASGNEVKHGKPHPDLFLLAAQRLREKPSACLVIEDAPSGIKAAKAGGMKAIAITTTHVKEDLKDADKIIDSFEDLTIRDIKNL